MNDIKPLTDEEIKDIKLHGTKVPHENSCSVSTEEEGCDCELGPYFVFLLRAIARIGRMKERLEVCDLCGFRIEFKPTCPDCLLRFRSDERERCAQIVDSMSPADYGTCMEIARAIRGSR